MVPKQNCPTSKYDNDGQLGSTGRTSDASMTIQVLEIILCKWAKIHNSLASDMEVSKFLQKTYIGDPYPVACQFNIPKFVESSSSSC